MVAGSGFGSAFFLHEYLRHARRDARVLVLEKGVARNHAWQLEHPLGLQREAQRAIDNRTSKLWVFNLALGGGSNCWWAATPRMLPADFELRTRYGVGRDWPLGYDDLEPYYGDAEHLMQVAGPSDDTPFTRSRPYPQPPHTLSRVDELLKASFPDKFFHLPCARPTRATGKRPPCCGSGVCGLCPVDAKFTIANGLPGLFSDPRVTLETGASVDAVDVQAGQATSLIYRSGGREQRARGELFVLGTNGLFNPHILLRSSLDGPAVGRGLVEQLSVDVDVPLAEGAFPLGSTSMTGHGYAFYDGPHRRRRGAALVETWSVPLFASPGGPLRQRVKLKFIIEDLPLPNNRVEVSPDDPTRPLVVFEERSDYAMATLRRVGRDAETLLASLPVEKEVRRKVNNTESHILGTTAMGVDPASSVVDAGLVHHTVRNLVVVGSSVFPTAPPANPSLTLCALSLRAARRLLS